jgi:uncharacterized phiE125 gp8 family phage protein
MKIITPPAQVIDLPTLRLQLKQDVDVGGTHPLDDLTVSRLEAARAFAQWYTTRGIGQQTGEIALDAFPLGPIALEYGPVATITTVTYVDTSGVTQTLPSIGYTLDDYKRTPWLVQAYGTSWPATLPAINAVKVRYVTGYATLPGPIKAALLLHVKHLTENESGTSKIKLEEVPLGICALLDTEKIWSM